MITMSQIIDAIIQRESAEYTNNPSDHGGPTKYGITQATLSKYRKRPVTPEEVAALTEPEARDIYAQVYGAPFQLPSMTDSLLGLLVDSAVQHGEDDAMKWFQAAIGAKPDGDAGPKTVATWIALADKNSVYASVLKTRIKYYAHLIHDDHTQAVFANGWFNRVSEFVR